MQNWFAFQNVDKRIILNAVLAALRAPKEALLGANYYEKRFLELLLLASQALQSHATPQTSQALQSHATPQDLDQLVPQWPVGNGTRAGLRVIWPSSGSDRQARPLLKALQRALGGGRRTVPIVRISAFLCFWKRCLEGSMRLGFSLGLYPSNESLGYLIALSVLRSRRK